MGYEQSQTYRAGRLLGAGALVVAGRGQTRPGREGLTTAVLRFGTEPATWALPPASVVTLLPVAPCGLPLALACRRMWRLGYPLLAWTAGVVLGVVTVAASLVAGLLGPLAIAVYAVILSLPVRVAGWGLNRRSHRLESPPLRVRPERTRPPGPFRLWR